MDGQWRNDKFVGYWKISTDRISDMTRIFGNTWEYLKQNTMAYIAQNYDDMRGEWFDGFAKIINTKAFKNDKILLDECIAAQTKSASSEFYKWLAAESAMKGTVTQKQKDDKTKHFNYKAPLP